MCTVALSYSSLELFILGYPEQAGSRSSQAINWSRTVRNPHNFAFSLNYAALLKLLQQSDAISEDFLNELCFLATDYQFPAWLHSANIMRGYVLTKRGKCSEGLAIARQGWVDRAATGSLWHGTYYLGLLAIACESAGHVDDALDLLSKAMEIAERTGERWFEAELHRVRGELIVAHDRYGGSEEAEVCFRRALVVAKEQDAKAWELRAAASLARLWRAQGKSSAACDLLAPIYSWFTEGMETHDLRAAKELLDALRE